MKRRDFFQAAAGAGLASTAIAAPAIAQSAPDVHWRLTSSYPKSLDTIYGAAETLSRYVAEATDNKFKIQVFAAGEIVGALQVLDAVQDGTVQCGHTVGQFYWGKDPAFALATGGPFCLNSRMHSAWLYYGGGNELLDKLFAQSNITAFPCGNTGAQMGGWFRKEIKTVQDLNGLKIRIAGLTGSMLQKLGVVPQQIAAGEIYPALERGTIDASEWVGPYDDEKLGLVKVAPYYYYPGFWEASAQQHLLINRDKFNSLPAAYKGVLKAATQAVNCDMQAKYDAVNPAALKRLAGAGAQLRPFSVEILDACFGAAQEVYSELSAKNPTFKTIYDSMARYRAEAYLWFQLAEYNYDSYMMRQQRAGKL